MDSEVRLGGGRYVVKGILGEGSQGTTYEATDSESGALVAIKRFDVRGARSWKDVELAEREARVLATLDHPLVPRYLANFEEDGSLYLVMAKVEGETLEAIRKREGCVSEAEVRRFLVCADNALTYLHGRGSQVVHRDVKPGNVVRRPDGSYVLVDFGAVSESLVKRGSSTIVGTIGYMAPEQLQGRASPASDVYAVGATALAALTGADPDTLPHRGLRVDVAAALGGRVSAGLVESLTRMLEPDPDLRAQSVGFALESATSPAVPLPARGAPSAFADPSREDAFVAGFRKLIWPLWGIGWLLAPMILGKLLGRAELVPIVMFGWLALNLTVSSHHGAVLRMLLRAWNGEQRSSAPVRRRVAASDGSVQVRVKTSELAPEETVAGTDVEVSEPEPEKGRERARRVR